MLSIIICTYNRDKFIYQSLSCLAKNDFPSTDYEIVLINNNSTDNTEEECERFKKDFPQINFRYFIETQQGLSFARNRGIKESNGNFLVFLDDDAFVSETYLNNLQHHLLEKIDLKAFGGKITPIFESGKVPKWYSYWTMPIVSALDKGKKIKIFKGKSYPIGANMGFYKSCVEKVGDFNVELGRKKKNLAGGEEKDIFNRFKENGLTIYYLPNIEVQHVIPESRTTYDYIRKLGVGVGVSEYIRCKHIGKIKLFNRYCSEIIKWIATIILWIYYALQGKFAKGNVLVLFRKEVSKGLFFIKNL